MASRRILSFIAWIGILVSQSSFAESQASDTCLHGCRSNAPVFQFSDIQNVWRHLGRKGSESAGSRFQKHFIFHTDRPIESYFEAFGESFQRDLLNLGANDQWLDMGAGEGKAIENYLQGACGRADRLLPEFFNEICKPPSGHELCKIERKENCGRPISSRASVAGVTLKLSRTPPEYDGKYRMFARDFTDVDERQIGTVKLATDHLGVLYYSEQLDAHLAKALRLLAPDGVLYLVPNGAQKVFVGKEVKFDHTMLNMKEWIIRNPTLNVELLGSGALRITKKPNTVVKVPKLRHNANESHIIQEGFHEIDNRGGIE